MPIRLDCLSDSAMELPLTHAMQGSTENNFGSSGATWMTSPSNLYHNHVPGSAVFLAYGVNDIIQSLAPAWTNEILGLAEHALVYASLPASSIVKPFTDPGVVQSGFSGSASNSISSFQLSTITPGSYVTATVTGRWIALASTVYHNPSVVYSLADYSNITISVDGSPVIAGVSQQFNSQNSNGYGGSGCSTPADPADSWPYCGYSSMTFLYVYDTLSSASATHQVTFTFNANYGQFLNLGAGNGYGVYTSVDWFAGWSTTTQFSPVMLLPIYPFYITSIAPDWTRTGSSFPATMPYWPATNTSLQLRNELNVQYKHVARRLRRMYNMSTYFIEDASSYGKAGIYRDGLHPVALGNQFIANRIVDFFTRGELP